MADKRMYIISEPGFEISKIKPRIFNFSMLKWLFRHRNIRTSLPTLRTNTVILYKRMYNQLIVSYDESIRVFHYTRNFVEGKNALVSVMDEKIITMLQNNNLLSEWYYINSPYASQLIGFIPTSLLYARLLNNNSLLHFKYKYAFKLKFLFLIGKPVRQFLSGCMHFGSPFLCELYYYLNPVGFPRFHLFAVYKVLMLMLGICSEGFGESFEPYIEIQPIRPMPVRLKNYNSNKLLKRLVKQRYLIPPILDVVLYDEIELVMVEESVPRILPYRSQILTLPAPPEILTLPASQEIPLKSIIKVPLNKVLEVGTKERREKLRLRSQIRARKTRNAVTRILLLQ